MKTHRLALGLVFLTGSLHALPELSPDAYGLRLGYGTENGSDMFSAEAMLYLDSNWEWALNESLKLELEPETSIGLINGHGNTAATVHLGIAASIESTNWPVELVFSSGPTLLSDDTFDTFDMGGHFQFTSGAGFDWNLSDEWSLGYRFQHISNGGIESVNPGLNLHVLSVIREF